MAPARREMRAGAVAAGRGTTGAMIPYVTEPPDIAIPAHLLPSDGRFGSGPSKVRPEQVKALASAADTYVATFCLIDRLSQHLCFGEFSSKFAAAVQAAPHLEDPQVVESPPGTRPRS